MYWLFMKTRKDLCSISSVTWQKLVCGVKYRVRQYVVSPDFFAKTWI